MGSQVQIPAEVGPGRAVGQLVAQGGRRLTDPEFLSWLEVWVVTHAYRSSSNSPCTRAHSNKISDRA